MELSVKANVLDRFNYAAVSCGEKMIDNLTISNTAGKEVVLRITTVPEVMDEYKRIIPVNGKAESAPKLVPMPEFCRENLGEAMEGEVKIEVLDSADPEKVLGFQNYPIHIQPYLHWDTCVKKTLACFRQPNHPLVGKIVSGARKYAEEYKIPFIAYHGKTEQEVIKNNKLLIQALYMAVFDEKIGYILYPPSYEISGQKVRIPAHLLNADIKQGTCLDTTVLFASCLEAVGLHPVMIVKRGHAFAGAWLLENVFYPGALCEDTKLIADSKEGAGGMLYPVETTAFTTDCNCTFEDAVSFGNDAMDDCMYAIDIKQANAEGLFPVFSYIENAICNEQEEYKETDVPEAKEVPEEDRKYYRVSKQGMTKLQRLEKQALDISAKNNLLAKKQDNSQISFPISTEKFFADEYNGRKLYFHAKNCILRTGVSEKKFDQALRNLYILGNQAKKERGKDTLYLAINELILKREKDRSYLNAPIYLQAVEVESDNRGEYSFRVKDEEIFFNPVLKEFLQMEFGIDVSELDQIPMDQYKEQMDYLRYCIGKKKDWKIHENVASVAAFSIPNEAIWNGLKNPKLLENKVVAGLINGVMDWENELKTNGAKADEHAVYALQADASQRKVIESAGNTVAQAIMAFAGNGKSQTAVNVIADRVAQGEKVLFVSKKLTALEVIYSMLDKIGMSTFSLCVTGDKKAAQNVANQIAETYRFMEQYEKVDSDVLDDKKYKASAHRLSDFHERMREPGDSGKSMQDMICMYEQLSHVPGHLNWREARRALNHESAEDIVDSYIEAIRSCSMVHHKYLKYLSFKASSPEEKQYVRDCVEDALDKFEQLKLSLNTYEQEAGISFAGDSEKERIAQTIIRASKNQRDSVLDTWNEFVTAQAKAAPYVFRNEEAFAKDYPNELKVTLLEAWRELDGREKDILVYQKILKDANEIGLTPILHQITDLVQSGQIQNDQIKDVYEKCWCEYNMEKIMRLNPELQSFDSVRYQVALNQYRTQEEKLRESLHKELVDTQMSRLPKVEDGVKDPQWSKLKKAVHRKGRATSVRTIFEQAPDLLAKMYPCMLMTPDAVAEVMPENFPEFDLVIIDEGSQLPTYEALIPISKGKRCMIFGDEMQLTPTSFFQKRLEEEDGFTSPIESILDDGSILGIPKKTLKTHYRSENENLIAFSNHMFYHNDVVTFPSCETKVSGVDYIYVEDGCYDRGKSKTNVKEAERAALQISNIYGSLPEETKETAAIITTNANQRELIHSVLLEVSAKDPKLAKKIDEQVQVTTIENCQGKEWDQVVLSLNFGPDADGHFTNNFGPIGGEDGGNRLNVMTTRAKKHMYVVTSLTPEMLGDDLSGGSLVLKKFLAFARGDMKLDMRIANVSANTNPIAQTLVKKLKEKGYEVHTNIGSSKCKVDIGIVSKTNPDVYQLGILLDDFSHSKYLIKDREIIGPDLLKKKGWNLYRLHSLNWYENPEYEVNQILQLLKEENVKTA